MNIQQQIINKASQNPKSLFLIDGFGALVSAVMLGVVLPQFENLFGMPRATLMILAALPCFFIAYDLFAYFFVRKNYTPFLKGIAFINIGYCLLSVYFLFQHHSELTSLGYAYFIIELALVLGVAYIELKTANQIKT